jgi:hypothetical protein
MAFIIVCQPFVISSNPSKPRIVPKMGNSGPEMGLKSAEYEGRGWQKNTSTRLTVVMSGWSYVSMLYSLREIDTSQRSEITTPAKNTNDDDTVDGSSDKNNSDHDAQQQLKP